MSLVNLDILACRESESLAYRAYLVVRVVQKETRGMQDFQDSTEKREIRAREDREDLKERRVIRVKFAPCCPQTWATQWLCKGSRAPRERPESQEQGSEVCLGLRVQMGSQDARERQDQMAAKVKRENRVPPAPRPESRPLTRAPASWDRKENRGSQESQDHLVLKETRVQQGARGLMANRGNLAPRDPSGRTDSKAQREIRGCREWASRGSRVTRASAACASRLRSAAALLVSSWQWERLASAAPQGPPDHQGSALMANRVRLVYLALKEKRATKEDKVRGAPMDPPESPGCQGSLDGTD